MQIIRPGGDNRGYQIDRGFAIAVIVLLFKFTVIINLRTAWVHRNHPMASPSFLFAEDLCIITRRPDLQYSTLATTYATNSRSPSVLQRQSQTSSPSGRASAGSTWRPKYFLAILGGFFYRTSHIDLYSMKRLPTGGTVRA
jgi:hypothetical protein